MKDMTEFLGKISEIKESLGKLTKDVDNDFFKCKYFDINKLLENVEPFMVANKLIITQPIINNSVYSIIQSTENPDLKIESAIQLPANESNPQKIGSCITYYRRYTLKSLLALQEEDDDGNKGAGNKAPEEKAVSKTLTAPEVENKWNGKIYSDKYVYIDNVKYEIPKEQITKLKAHDKFKDK